VMSFFKTFELSAWGWLWTTILLISASWVARITGVSHQNPAVIGILNSHGKNKRARRRGKVPPMRSKGISSIERLNAVVKAQGFPQPALVSPRVRPGVETAQIWRQFRKWYGHREGDSARGSGTRVGHWGKKKLDSYLTPSTKINFQWSQYVDLNNKTLDRRRNNS
jgi:hypothetical protein